MGKRTQRSWLSIVAMISLIATLAPGAAAQHKERRTRLRWLALLSGLLLATTTFNTVSAAGDDTPDPYEQYGDIGCTVVPGFNDRCPSMVSEPLAPRSGTTKEFIYQAGPFVSPDGSMFYSVGAREDDFSYSLTTITAWRLDPGNLGADGTIAWKRDFGGTVEFPRTKPGEAQMSHDGTRLYVTGLVWVEDNYPASNVREIWVGAFDTADGEVVWVRKLRGAVEERENVRYPASVSVSPDDSQVFASATAIYLPNLPTDPGSQWSRQYALDASTGEVEWQTDYRDHRVNYAHVGSPQREEVSPDGSRLFSIVRLQGNEASVIANTGYAAIAYDTATGEIIWSRKYLFPEEDGSQSVPYFMILSPDGRKVIVAVRHQFNGGLDGARYRFTAYDAIDGDTLWVKEHSANTGTGCDQENWVSLSYNAPALAVNPSGDTVYLTGFADYRHPDATDGGCNSRTKNDPSRAMAATVLLAVDTDSGELRWEKHYGQDGGYSCNPCSITMVPGPNASDAGSKIVVISDYFVWEIGRQYPWTFLVDAASGDRVWQARYLDTYNDGKTFIRQGGQLRAVVTADGSRVYRVINKYSPTRGWTRSRDQVIGYDLDPVRAPTPDPDPTPTPTVTPTGEPTPTPTPSQSPAPDVTDVSFTERSQTSGQYSDETLLEARLTGSGGDPIQGKELTFDLVGAESSRSFTATTNGDGLAAVTPRLEENPGPYQLTVRYDGDEEHAGDADTMSFLVEKEDSALELSVEGEDDAKTLRARLSDLDTSSEGIPERAIDFYSDGELIGSAVTDVDGVASVALPPRHRGNNRTYEAVFDGDDFYLGASDDRRGKGKGGNGGGGNGGRDASTGYGGKVLLM